MEQIALKLLEDEQPEVRIKASSFLSGLFHCQFIPSPKDLLVSVPSTYLADHLKKKKFAGTFQAKSEDETETPGLEQIGREWPASNQQLDKAPPRGGTWSVRLHQCSSVRRTRSFSRYFRTVRGASDRSAAHSGMCSICFILPS